MKKKLLNKIKDWFSLKNLNHIATLTRNLMSLKRMKTIIIIIANLTAFITIFGFLAHKAIAGIIALKIAIMGIVSEVIR